MGRCRTQGLRLWTRSDLCTAMASLRLDRTFRSMPHVLPPDNTGAASASRPEPSVAHGLHRCSLRSEDRLLRPKAKTGS